MTAKWLLPDVNHLDGWAASAMLAAACCVLPEGVHPVVRNPQPLACRALLRCRDVSPWDLELCDETRPGLARPGRAMATS